MSNTYQDLQNSHPCFGGHKNNVGRIHLELPGMIEKSMDKLFTYEQLRNVF